MRIYKLNDDSYSLVKNSTKITGDRSKIIATMLLIGVSSYEIEIGLSELDTSGASYAEYGIGMYIPNDPNPGPKFIYAAKLAS